MAGHSHWAKIKRAKGATDAKRGKVWSKIARKIIIAAKNGGDPRDNLSLRYTIDEAKAANMPKDTIEKAILKGTGELGAENYEAAVYEAYAPGGVALMIDALTNNRARTAPELRSILEKHGANLATSGAVAFQFQKQGIIDRGRDDRHRSQRIDVRESARARDHTPLRGRLAGQNQRLLFRVHSHSVFQSTHCFSQSEPYQTSSRDTGLHRTASER